MKEKKNKKFILLLVTGIFLSFFCIPNVMASRIEYDNICSESSVLNALKIVSYVIQIARWLGPLIIIVLGMVDFTKAIASNDENAITKASGALIRRIVSGICISLIPTLIIAILSITLEIDINKEKTTIGDTNLGKCTACLFDPNRC